MEFHDSVNKHQYRETMRFSNNPLRFHSKRLFTNLPWDKETVLIQFKDRKTKGKTDKWMQKQAMRTDD